MCICSEVSELVREPDVRAEASHPTIYTGPFVFQDGVRCCSRLPRAPWGAPTLSATAPTVLFYNFPLSRLYPPTGR